MYFTSDIESVSELADALHIEPSNKPYFVPFWSNILHFFESNPSLDFLIIEKLLRKTSKSAPTWRYTPYGCTTLIYREDHVPSIEKGLDNIKYEDLLLECELVSDKDRDLINIEFTLQDNLFVSFYPCTKIYNENNRFFEHYIRKTDHINPEKSEDILVYTNYLNNLQYY